MLKTQVLPIRVLNPGMLLLFLSLFLYSCKKDSPIALNKASAGIQATPNEGLEYDRIGGNLEKAFSFAVQDNNFKWLIVLMTQEKVDGDYEVKLSDLMAVPMKTGGTALDHFLALANEQVTRQDIESFMAAHPGTIVAVRGNPGNWLRGTSMPPVKFVPHDFSEGIESTTATQNGTQVSLDLSSSFTDAVVVIMKSERHDSNGELVTSSQGERTNSQTTPVISASDVTGSSQLRVTCDPEPTSCPSTIPNLVSFTATPENGGVKLSFNIQNLPSTFCNWGRIKITRFNPNNTTTIFDRRAHQGSFFYDNTGSFGVTYSYTCEVYVAYISSAGGWITCPATNNLQSASAQYPQIGSTVDTYTGSNQTSNSIRYDWLPPSSGIANEYRIRRATPTGYSTLISGIPGTQFDHFYNPVPWYFKGTLIETQIQYKAGGPWQGNFFDRTYASFRDPGEPLYFHGVRMDVQAFEYSESPLYGAPEIRLTALQANAAESTDKAAQTFLPMSGCLNATQVEQLVWDSSTWLYVLYGVGEPTTVEVTYYTNSGYYYPSDAPNGYEILNSWNPDLYGSAIKVSLKETDIGVPIVTGQTNTSSTEVSINAKFGFKLFKVIGADIGVESTWKDASTTTIRYPDSDLDIEVDKLIYYHEPQILTKGRALFGNQLFPNQCAALQAYL